MEVGQKNECVKKFLSRFNFNESIPINDWTEVLSIKYGQKEKYSVYKTLRQYIEFCWNDPILAYLEIPKELHHLTDLGNIIQSYEKEQTAKVRKTHVMNYNIILLTDVLATAACKCDCGNFIWETKKLLLQIKHSCRSVCFAFFHLYHIHLT